MKPSDTLILTEEGPSSLGECYIPTYHLSVANSLLRFGHNYSQALFHDASKKPDDQPAFFHGNTLVNWGIFTMPRHPLFARILANIVEIGRSEYFQLSVLHVAKWDVRWKYTMCSTGFTLTYTLREMSLANASELFVPARTSHESLSVSSENVVPRIVENDFHEYGGKAKAIWTGADPNHYMKALSRLRQFRLLTRHAELDFDSYVRFLEGSPVTGESKTIYFIFNGTRHTFPDYETFLSRNVTLHHTRHISEQVLQRIPLGPPMPSVLSNTTNATET